MRRKRRIAFTKRALETLPPHDPTRNGGNGTEWSDTETTGLRIVCGPDKKHFLHRYTWRGKKQCIALGEWPFVSIAEARAEVMRQRVALSRGENPKAEREEKQSVPTFSSFAKEYLEHAKKHKKSWREDEWRIEKVLSPVLGDLPLDEITTRRITKLHNDEKERTSNVSSNHIVRLLRRMLGMAVDFEMLKELPKFPKFFPEKARERFLDRRELGAWVRALEEMGDNLSAKALLLLTYTGARKMEILGLERCNVFLEENRAWLPETKNGSGHSLLLNAKAKELLEGLLATDSGSPYVFPGPKGDTHLCDVRKTFETAKRAAGISEFRIHDIRHTFGTYAAIGAKSLTSVSGLLNHHDASSTRRYAHHVNDELLRASNQVVEEIEKAVV